MIDLTGAKVGDKFVLTNGLEAELILRTSDALILNSSGGITVMVDNQGESQHSNSGLSIKSKHDTRPWLKYLPDADLFAYDWLACDLDGVWYYYSDEPSLSSVNWRANSSASSQAGHLDCIVMATLTGDQWKDSKISIPELKTWQLANQ